MANQFSQKTQLKESGSLFNWLMANNQSIPVVGKGCTELSWTDRHAYEVISVSDDQKVVMIQAYEPKRIDKNGMCDSQTYKYEKLVGDEIKIVWRWGAWRREIKTIMFEEEYAKTMLLYPEGELIVLPGKTKMVTTYEKIKILWGVLDHFYDYSF